MNKSVNKKRYLIRWFICAGIFAVAFILLIGMKLSDVGTKTPFFADISEIATNGEHVYILDDRNTVLNAYNNNGDFIWRINFSSTGASRIFCDDNGAICRLDVRDRTVWVYDEQGNVLNSYRASAKELIDNGTIPNREQNSIEIGGADNMKYHLQKNMIADSTVYVSRGQETMACFVVESWESHVIWCMIILLLIVTVVYGAYNLICFICHRSGMINNFYNKGRTT